MIPQEFLDRIKTQLGEEYPAFLESLERPRAVALRFNPLKTKDFPQKKSASAMQDDGCAMDLLVLQILVDGSGGLLAGAHCQNDGSSAGDGVAAGVNTLAGGQGVLIHDADGFRLTGCHGKLQYSQGPLACYSLYSDYFWYEIGDMIGIGNQDVLYYLFPKNCGDVVAKTRLAQEELYKLKKIKKA